jgi:serine/threonine-protein kinase
VTVPPSDSPRELGDSQATSVLPLGPGRDPGNRPDDRDTADEPVTGITAPGKVSTNRRAAPSGRQEPDATRPLPPAQNSRNSRGSSPAGALGESRFPPGTVLAQRYRIVRLLGRGGMGEVFCAEDLELGQLVAIKLLPEAWERDPARLERLRSELRLARSVTHPHVCRVYDIGEADGRRFLSMEYIDGEDLDALLRRIGRLPADTAAEIGAQICQGLAAIHESGILHRDLKPANLLLDTRGRVRIADFGLAGLAQEETERGFMQGTPAYMAPEQLVSQEVSLHTDLYALGLILHKLFTGKSAFEARTPGELYRMRQEAAPPAPSTLASNIAPAIDDIIVRCLAPEPRDRPASAREVLDALVAGAAPAHAPALVVAVASAGLDGAALVAHAGGAVALRVAEAHAQILDELCQHHAGTRVATSDVPLALFEHPGDAVCYALAYQRAVQVLAQREDVALAVRVGVHLGVRPRTGQSGGPGTGRSDVDAATRDLAARLSKLAEPGQILLTRNVFDLARQVPLAGAGTLQWLAHGSYEIEGVSEPADLYEVGSEGSAPLTPPRESAQARRRMVQDVIAGWRPAPGLELPRRPSWRMEKKLGQGGFGEVWLAAHAKTGERRVFKFCYDAERLRALQREITLFRLLKETLGDRNDIARILDWSFDEAPYFIEAAYTAGGNLVDWAAERGGLAAIPLATRLEIVAQVATALAAAHSVGVLHKDVKPANVLMTSDVEGRPRAQLGDFGIGAILEKGRLAEIGITAMGWTAATGTEILASADGTRLYMAPELLEGKPATTQADIYALGVMLYQIVVGDFARALAPGWERDIDDELLRADIAAAVDGAPLRRVGHAAEIADKLRALAERRAELAAIRAEVAERQRERTEAELARRALARARKRRKSLALVTAALLLFAGTVTVQSLRIAREAEAAAVAGKTARQVSDFLVELFEVADPYTSPDRDIPAREILDRGKEKIDALAASPEVQAELMHVMGVVYGNIGLFQESAALLEDAVTRRRQLHGGERRETADSLHALARTREAQQGFEPAARAAREAWDMRRALLGEEHADTVASMELLADALLGLGKIRDAEPLYREVLAIRRRRLGLEHAQVAQALARLGMLHSTAQDHAQAAPWFQEALDMYRRLPGDHARDIADVEYWMGLTHVRRGDLAAAEPLFQASLATRKRLFGDEHPVVATLQMELGRLYLRTGKYAQAEPLFHALLAFYRTSMGEESLPVGMTLGELSFLARLQGDCARADALSREVLARYRSVMPGDHDLVAAGLGNRAHLLATWGKPEEAAPLYQDALDMYLRLHGEGAPLASVIMASLAEVHMARGALQDAAPLLERARALLDRQAPPEPWLRPYLDSVRGVYLSKTGHADAAEQLLASAYESMRTTHGPYRYYTLLAAERVIAFHEARGRTAEARKHGSLPTYPGCTSTP